MPNKAWQDAQRELRMRKKELNNLKLLCSFFFSNKISDVRKCLKTNLSGT